MAFTSRFCSTSRSSPASPRTVGSVPATSISAPLSSIIVARSARTLVTSRSKSTSVYGRLDPPDAREGQQVVDQVLHPPRAVDGEADVLVGARVELASVALLEQLAEARDLAQRLLQVVRGDVGELLELGVGALEVLLRVAHRRELGHDPRPHRVHVLAQVEDLARARALDLMLEVAARDGPRATGQALQRQHDLAAQDERHRDDAEQHDDPGSEDPEQDDVGVAVEPVTRRLARREQAALEPGYGAAERVEALLPGGDRVQLARLLGVGAHERDRRLRVLGLPFTRRCRDVVDLGADLAHTRPGVRGDRAAPARRPRCGARRRTGCRNCSSLDSA